jgi:hypothetical protein
MMDDYGDGWNGNFFNVDGSDPCGYTLKSGNYDTAQVCVPCDDMQHEFMITVDGGSYKSEVSWELHDDSGNLVLYGYSPVAAPYSNTAMLCGGTTTSAPTAPDVHVLWSAQSGTQAALLRFHDFDTVTLDDLECVQWCEHIDDATCNTDWHAEGALSDGVVVLKTSPTAVPHKVRFIAANATTNAVQFEYATVPAPHTNLGYLDVWGPAPALPSLGAQRVKPSLARRASFSRESRMIISATTIIPGTYRTKTCA